MEAASSVGALPRPGPADIQPVQHETADRAITGLVTGLPVLCLGLAVWQAWNGLLRPGDLLVFLVVYVLTGLGVTVGFHRLLTHRSFKGDAARPRHPRGARLGGDRGPRDLVGGRSPQAPRLCGRPGGSATAHTSTTAWAGRVPCAGSCTRTSAGSSGTTSAEPGRGTRRT